jgi:hypothetical protein
MVMNTRWFYLLSKLQRERGREGGERERERERDAACLDAAATSMARAGYTPRKVD